MEKALDKIQILMSTYNGERYLKEQLDSILEQDCKDKGIECTLLVRDDGSKDGTQKILEEYAKKYSTQIEWYLGENKGVIQSFFELLQRADDMASYYAFADQDDFWMPDKISSGISSIQKLEQKEDGRPYLYCCKPMPVNEKLEELDSQIKRPVMRTGFGNALIENIVTGCTAVFNRTLRQMAIKELPEYTFMHDWWLYLIATCYGSVVYDETPHIKYRQHGDNAVGNNVSLLHEFWDRLRLFQKKKHNASRQVTEFLRIFDTDSFDTIKEGQTARVTEHLALAREMVQARKHFMKRIRLLRKHKIYRQRKGDHRVFMLFLLIGMY
jgi:glycosyltransferase involved in cell wall biosynthesis